MSVSAYCYSAMLEQAVLDFNLKVLCHAHQNSIRGVAIGICLRPVSVLGSSALIFRLRVLCAQVTCKPCAAMVMDTDRLCPMCRVKIQDCFPMDF